MSASTYWTTPVMRRLRRKTILTRRRRQMALVMQRKEQHRSMARGGRGSEGEGTLASLKEAKELLTILPPCLLTMMKWLVERGTRKKAKGKSRQKSADKEPQARKKPEKPKTYEDAGPTTHGAADRGFKANFTPEPAAEIPRGPILRNLKTALR